jgi:hypothetical protein
MVGFNFIRFTIGCSCCHFRFLDASQDKFDPTKKKAGNQHCELVVSSLHCLHQNDSERLNDASAPSFTVQGAGALHA